MKCVDVNSKLEKYIDGALSKNERQEIANHLKICPDCKREIELLKRVDALGKLDIYPEPPAEYWKTLPKTITTRLGLRSETTQLEKLSTFFNTLFLSKSFRWGLASAFAILIFIFLFKEKNYFISDIDENLEVKASESISQNLHEKVESPKIQSKDLNEDNQIIIAKEPITSLRPRKQQITFPSIQQLYPISPSESFESKSKSKVHPKEMVPERLAFQRSENVQQIQNKQSPTGTIVLDLKENSFAETLWFVQQSETLNEKKNIWLSYIMREPDPTYRSLGIYHLALILSKQVENSKDLNKAMEALNFYKKNEKSLRFQIGKEEYQRNIDFFKTIIKNR